MKNQYELQREINGLYERLEEAEGIMARLSSHPATFRIMLEDERSRETGTVDGRYYSFYPASARVLMSALEEDIMSQREKLTRLLEKSIKAQEQALIELQKHTADTPAKNPRGLEVE